MQHNENIVRKRNWKPCHKTWYHLFFCTPNGGSAALWKILLEHWLIIQQIYSVSSKTEYMYLRWILVNSPYSRECTWCIPHPLLVTLKKCLYHSSIAGGKARSLSGILISAWKWPHLECEKQNGSKFRIEHMGSQSKCRHFSPHPERLWRRGRASYTPWCFHNLVLCTPLVTPLWHPHVDIHLSIGQSSTSIAYRELSEATNV